MKTSSQLKTLFVASVVVLVSGQAHAQWDLSLQDSFDPTLRLEVNVTPGAPWVARHGLTSAQYQQEFNTQVANGYRLTYVSGYTAGGVEKFAALFEKSSGPAWIARHGLTSAEYQQEFNTQVANGYRLVLVNGYTAPNNTDKYVAIWQKSSGPAWVARHGLTGAQYQQEFDAQSAKGYRLVHVSGYAVNNEARYAAIWTQGSGPAYIARHGLTPSQYQAEFDTQTQNGYRLVDVSGYGVNGGAYYAAIWEQSQGGAYQARHGLSSQGYQQTFDTLSGQGYRPILVSGYTVNGSDRYAAIFTR